MKKLFVSLVAFFAMVLCLEAQEKLDTWSVYDVDKDTKVNVKDVTDVVDRAKKAGANDQQVVDAAQLNAVLEAISEKLKKLEQLDMIKVHIDALEAKLGITPADVHEYVDLGLSVKWATCNVGAEKPEDAGLYFAWGETEGYTANTSDGRLFDWTNYKWMDHTINDWTGCTKYTCTDGQTPASWYAGDTYIGTKVDGTWYKNLTTLQPEDDAATANWGGSWRMPTDAELTKLRTDCTWTWDSTKKGYKVTSKKNGNSIFLPAAGYRYVSGLDYAGSYGFYWSSSLDTSYSYDAYNVYFDSGDVSRYALSRFFGRSVRPVCP